MLLPVAHDSSVAQHPGQRRQLPEAADKTGSPRNTDATMLALRSRHCRWSWMRALPCCQTARARTNKRVTARSNICKLVANEREFQSLMDERDAVLTGGARPKFWECCLLPIIEVRGTSSASR